MSNPMVSIGIPSYNHEKYISETIESILNQTFQDFEIIITDDGSSDKTVEMIKNFSDPRIKLFVFEENQGACKALNNCINHSKGKYFAYVSSDDIWEHTKLEKQVKYLDENLSIPAVFTKVKIIDEDGGSFSVKNHPYCTVFDQENRSRSEWLKHFFYRGNCICHPSIMIRKETYEEIGYYNERMANLPDFDMWIRLCLKYDLHILDEKLTKFRVRMDENNVSGDKPSTMIRSRFEKLHILDHYLEIEDIEFFLKVFPESEKFGIPKQGMIPYFLARLAIEIDHDLYILWALNTLYNLMQSTEVVDKLEREYNFSYPEFIEMSADNDFFNSNKLLRLNKEIIKRNSTIKTINHEKSLLNKEKSLLNKNVKTLIRQKKAIIKDKNDESKKLKAKIEDLRSDLFEARYRSNNNRSITQRMISRIPSIYILLNRNNKGIKNALINIKGYKAIKENKLLDIGYYLRYNKDIRLSGTDPILHYIYHGYKEGRKPNPTFSGDYYMKTYSDVKGLNPLVHYGLYGKNEGRKTIEDHVIKRKKSPPVYENNIDLTPISVEYSPDNNGINTLFFSHNLKMQGAQNSLYEMVIGLKNRGIVNPIVYSPSDGALRRAYEKNEVKVIIGDNRLQEPSNFEVFNDNLFDLINDLEGLKIQFIHSNTLRTFYGIELARKMYLPCSWNPRESEPSETYFDYLPEPVNEIALKCFDYPIKVIFVSNYTKDNWKHLENNNFTTIYNALNTERLIIDTANWTREESRASLGIDNHEIAIIAVGTISERKGQKDILLAIEKLKPEVMENVKIFLVGDSPSQYSDEVHELYSQLPSYLKESVFIVPETTNENEFFKVVDYYSAADILIFSSRIESYPRVILEALYFNLTIITTPVFGVREQVEDGFSALFYEPGDIEELANQILKLLNDDNLRLKLKENTKKQLEKLSTHDEMLDQYGEIILNAK